MKVLLADGQPLFRDGVKPVLQQLASDVSVTEAMDYPSLTAALSCGADFDLALVDVHLTGMAGVAGLHRIRDDFPSVPIVALSAAEGAEDMQRLFAAGVLGYFSKAAAGEMLLAALQRVLAGGVYAPPEMPSDGVTGDPGAPAQALTARQIEVLQELAKGCSNRQIAQMLQITEGTVKIHLAAVFRILKVSNRTEAVLAAQRLRLH